MRHQGPVVQAGTDHVCPLEQHGLAGTFLAGTTGATRLTGGQVRVPGRSDGQVRRHERGAAGAQEPVAGRQVKRSWATSIGKAVTTSLLAASGSPLSAA